MEIDSANRGLDSGGVDRNGERGQILPVVALALVVLIGAAALAVDVGYLRYVQRIQQSATDSAAIAGAAELGYPASGTVLSAAKQDASLNGFTHDGTKTIITAGPPASGPYVGNPNAVEVIIRSQHPMFFEQALGTPTTWVSTRAVALFGNGNGAGNCIYALQSDADMNASTINAPSCGIISNGIMNINGSTITAASIGAVGQINTTGSTYPEASPQHAIAGVDPCPSIAGCNALATSPPATSPCNYSNLNLSGTVTMNPGVYCQSTNINSAHITMNPGLYVWTNGLNGNATTFTGTGVTLYMVQSSFNCNSCSFNLTAPTTGSYAGILFFQPASNTSSENLNASGGSSVQGAIYLPTGTLTTNASFNTWLLVVAAIIHMNASNVNVPANSVFPGSVPHGYLAE